MLLCRAVPVPPSGVPVLCPWGSPSGFRGARSFQGLRCSPGSTHSPSDGCRTKVSRLGEAKSLHKASLQDAAAWERGWRNVLQGSACPGSNGDAEGAGLTCKHHRHV